LKNQARILGVNLDGKDEDYKGIDEEVIYQDNIISPFITNGDKNELSNLNNNLHVDSEPKFEIKPKPKT